MRGYSWLDASIRPLLGILLIAPILSPIASNYSVAQDLRLLREIQAQHGNKAVLQGGLRRYAGASGSEPIEAYFSQLLASRRFGGAPASTFAGMPERFIDGKHLMSWVGRPSIRIEADLTNETVRQFEQSLRSALALLSSVSFSQGLSVTSHNTTQERIGTARTNFLLGSIRIVLVPAQNWVDAELPRDEQRPNTWILVPAYRYAPPPMHSKGRARSTCHFVVHDGMAIQAGIFAWELLGGGQREINRMNDELALCLSGLLFGNASVMTWDALLLSSFVVHAAKLGPGTDVTSEESQKAIRRQIAAIKPED